MKRAGPQKRPAEQPRRPAPHRRETDAVLEQAKKLPPERQHDIAPTSESAYWFDYD